MKDNVIVKVQLPCGKHAIRKVERRHTALLETINAHGIPLALRDDSGQWWTADENGDVVKAAPVIADVWEGMQVFQPVQ